MNYHLIYYINFFIFGTNIEIDEYYNFIENLLKS